MNDKDFAEIFRLQAPAAPVPVEKTEREKLDEFVAAEEAKITLDDEQKWAADVVMEGDIPKYAIDGHIPVAVLTGAAGTGKSTVIKHLRDEMMVTVCATTGKAAMNVGGCTVDKLFNFSRDTWRVRDEQRLAKNMACCAQTVLIDESSMIGMQMASLIVEAADTYRKRIILVGDWGQARPVKDTWPMRSKLFARAQLVKLQKCHRQKDGPYLEALNRIRVGHCTEADNDLFKGRTFHEPPDRDFMGFCMFATNKTTDQYNNQCLDEHCRAHDKRKVNFQTRFVDMRSQLLQSQWPLDERRIARLIDDCPFAHNEEFAEGCKVVITQNIDNTVYNGDVGRIVELDPLTRSVVVEVHRRGYSFCTRLEEGELDSVDALGQAEAKFFGLPIRLGYGVTIHKSQGMTVDRAWVDMASICYFPQGSRHGLAYVALSRTRTLDGLMVSGWNTEALEVDEEIKPWL